ncbi:MAG TPA: sigma-70 family RNA polymerase sigma factor [Thermoanaerobaculia bacterium]|nr:sigma-70 family RNA polymerase sigma factor [Thermoanaerobaculia bacterium]
MPGSLFPTTRRSVIEALGSGDVEERKRAYDTLAAIYWRPLYKYARIIHGRNAADAEDLAQSLMVQAFERGALESYDPRRGSFRTFLRVVFDRLIVNHDKHAARMKRGGGATHFDFASAEFELSRENSGDENPEEYFQRQWVKSLFATVVDRCRQTFDPLSFAIFESYDLAPEDGVTYAQLARDHGVSEMAITNRLAAARRRFREIALELVREITASDDESRAEAHSLFGVDA